MRVMIATPAANGLVAARYCESLAQLTAALARKGIEHDYKTTRSADLEMSRNYLASTALALGFTHLLFIDADMAFRPTVFDRMAAQDKPVIGAVCPKRHLDLIGMLDALTPEDKGAPGWQRKFISRNMEYTGNPLEVDGRHQIEIQNGGFARYHSIGMGVTLIACDALRQIAERGLATQQRGTLHTSHVDYPVYGFFNRLQDAHGNLVAEDLSFCQRWRQCGGEVWVVLDEPIFHIGSYDYIGVFMDQLASK